MLVRFLKFNSTICIPQNPAILQHPLTYASDDIQFSLSHSRRICLKPVGCFWQLTKIHLTFSMISSKLLKWCVLQPSARSTSSWVASFRTWWSLSSGMWASWEITTKFISSSCKRTDVNNPGHFAVSLSISMLKRQTAWKEHWYWAWFSTVMCLDLYTSLQLSTSLHPSPKYVWLFAELRLTVWLFIYPTDDISLFEPGLREFYDLVSWRAGNIQQQQVFINPQEIQEATLPLPALWHALGTFQGAEDIPKALEQLLFQTASILDGNWKHQVKSIHSCQTCPNLTPSQNFYINSVSQTNSVFPNKT